MDALLPEDEKAPLSRLLLYGTLLASSKNRGVVPNNLSSLQPDAIAWDQMLADKGHPVANAGAKKADELSHGDDVASAFHAFDTLRDYPVATEAEAPWPSIKRLQTEQFLERMREKREKELPSKVAPSRKKNSSFFPRDLSAIPNQKWAIDEYSSLISGDINYASVGEWLDSGKGLVAFIESDQSEKIEDWQYPKRGGKWAHVVYVADHGKEMDPKDSVIKEYFIVRDSLDPSIDRKVPAIELLDQLHGFYAINKLKQIEPPALEELKELPQIDHSKLLKQLKNLEYLERQFKTLEVQTRDKDFIESYEKSKEILLREHERIEKGEPRRNFIWPEK